VNKLRILIAEDEPHLREVLALQLGSAGYEVLEAADGTAALARATETLPDLVLLDVMMPGFDGYEVCKRLRMSMLTRQIPIIMLTAKSETADKIAGLEGGANDYITKPWQTRELLLRIRNVLEWSQQQRAASPLTGLPGNHSINEELKRRLGLERPFAMLQIDVDHFKSFNDCYGYARGDEAIRGVANTLIGVTRPTGDEPDFVGHIGGDDFVVVTIPERADTIAEETIARFNELVRSLYDPADLERGYIEVPNRRHVMERFPFMSLTIALVSTDRMSVSHLAELSDIAQELKSHGKGIPGSVVVGERRRGGAEPTRNVA
jgi:diguanylate cyclase (GGDEF)-like protein